MSDINPLAAVNNEDLANTYKTLNRDLISDRAPGKLNMAGEVRGHYSHTAVKEFASINGPLDKQINDWAAEWPVPYLVCDIKYSPPYALVIYTINLDDEDIQEMNDHAEEIEQVLAGKRAARKAKKAAEAEAAKKVHEEEAELIKLGRRCRDNHSKKKDVSNDG